MVPRPSQRRAHRVLAGLTFAGLGGFLVAGCGGGDGEVDPETRGTLVDSLGFLSATGLSDAEIDCVADRIVDEVDEGDLEALSAAVARVEAGEISLADLPDEQGEVLTASVTACAGTGS